MTPSPPLPCSLARALTRTQAILERVYQLEPAPSVVPYVRVDDSVSREVVLVKPEANGEVALSVLLPPSNAKALCTGGADGTLDAYLGAVEGLSHFLHIAERARTGLPTTLLELELQAEVDKFVIVASLQTESSSREFFLLHELVYGEVSYLHAPDSEQGARYRMANDLAARLWSRLLRKEEWRTDALLPRFYRAGQAEKIRLAMAA